MIASGSVSDAVQLVEIAGAEDDRAEVTVYVKGFLGRGEDAGHFGRWHASHLELEERLGWGPYAVGYAWPSGRLVAPLPLFGAARSAWGAWRWVRGAGRANLVGLAGWTVAEELMRVVARFTFQYLAAQRSARERAADLAGTLRALRGAHERVRVVAHSLGCLHVVEAAARLDPSERPDEIHLCAPACLEGEVGALLAQPARGRTHLYFTRKDAVLEAAFRTLARGRALGAVGPEGDYPGLDAVDVSEHFEFWVHNRYPRRFARFATGDAPPGTFVK